MFIAALLAIGCATHGAQDWRPTTVEAHGPERWAPRLVTREGPGLLLRADSTALIRQRSASHEEVLPCTEPGGVGQVYDMVTEPGGLTFIGSEHGLFVTHPLAAASDPVTLRGTDLSPFTGQPVHSLAADIDRAGRRRIWLVVSGELLVMDPSFFWGGTVDAPQGAGGGPLHILAVRIEEDRLLVKTRTGEFERSLLSTNPGPAPTMAPGEASGPLRLQAGEALELDVHGDSLRYRIDGHHVWRECERDPISGKLVLPAQRPGAHRVDIVSVGPDLLRSDPLQVEVSADYPRRLPRGWWVILLLGVPALCAALSLFVVRWYLSNAGRMSYPRFRAILSCAVTAVIGLQVLAGLFPHAHGWPFVGFSMYTQVHYPGDLVFSERLGVLSPDGVADDIPPVLPGYAIDNEYQVLRPLIDGGERAARDWATNFVAHTPEAKIAGVQARARRLRLGPDGPVEIAPLILSHAYWGVAKGSEDPATR